MRREMSGKKKKKKKKERRIIKGKNIKKCLHHFLVYHSTSLHLRMHLLSQHHPITPEKEYHTIPRRGKGREEGVRERELLTVYPATHSSSISFSPPLSLTYSLSSPPSKPLPPQNSPSWIHKNVRASSSTLLTVMISQLCWKELNVGSDDGIVRKALMSYYASGCHHKRFSFFICVFAIQFLFCCLLIFMEIE